MTSSTTLVLEPERLALPEILTIEGYTKDQVRELIVNYSILYGIDPALPLRIAQCESGLRWDAKNSHSTASGVFQFIKSTWNNTPEGRDGRSVFNADANVSAAIRKIANEGTGAWDASASCWKS